MFTARSARPSAISRAASSEPPQTSALASCIPFEDRVVVGAEPVADVVSPSRAPGVTAARYDGDVHPLQLLVGRRLRHEQRHALQHAELAGQPHGQVQPDGSSGWSPPRS